MLAIESINDRLIFGIKAFSNYTNETTTVSASLATKVFIQRDYRDGTICKFQTKFPAELDSRIERSLFEETLKTLNCYYAEAEKIGGQSYLEGCLACATAYIIFLCMETRYEMILKKISMYIQEQNEKIYTPRGLLLTDPVERGMRVVSFAKSQDGFLKRWHHLERAKHDL
uniref:Golgin A7 family, member Bb n=1 Tax=Sinocyclocheilus rhinocerous TaxID=307959 RepID=A0A673ICK2_9TELE